MKKLLPIFISVFVMIVNVVSVQASSNILRGVDVRRGTEAYTIVLTSTAPADMTKTVVSSNRIILHLKNIDVSSNVSTKFNGNSVIDNVMVEPCGYNSANVMVQGDNIARSSVQFREPSTIETAGETLKASFSSLFSIMTGSSTQNRAIQWGTLGIFLLILFGELRFIASKFAELKQEKAEILKDIERTKDFKDYLPGYNRAGLKKPYTTPIYNNYANINIPKAKPVKPVSTPEIITLNNLLKQTPSETTMISRIVNQPNAFGTLSNVNIGDNLPLNNKQTVSNPLKKLKMKAKIKQLEGITALYKENATVNDIQHDFRSRLNKIY